MTTPNFADLSHHQPTFAVSTYAIHRRTVALKATEGTGFTDPMFATRWRAAAGLRRVAYHFARAKFNGADEWAHCWGTVRAAGFNPQTDIIALDVEDPNTPSRALTNAQEFINAAVKAGVTRGLIYTYPNYAREQHITAGAFAAGWRRLWFANYSPLADSLIALPAGWDSSQYYARQYSDQVMVPGVGLCDDNRIIKDWLGATPAPPVTNGGADNMAGWTDADSSNLAAVADWAERTYRSGFASVAPDGSADPTHLNVSVAGVNQALDVANGHLDAIHELVSDLAGVVSELATAVAVLVAAAAPTPPAPPTN